MTAYQERRMVKVGKDFFDIRHAEAGVTDDAGEPITYCPICSAQYDGVAIYHRTVSAIYK